MKKLESIAIAGFKSFGAEVVVPLGPINVLIGANGSGKSNFLGTFSFLQAFHSKRLEKYVAQAGGADRILHYGSHHTKQLSIRITFEDSDGYRLKFFRQAQDTLWLGMPRFPDVGKKERNTIKRLGAWRCYHFLDTSFNSPIKKTCKVDDNRFLREDGSNLAAFLYLLREKHRTSYRMIRSAVQRVAPFFEDFLLEPRELNPDTIRLQWKHTNSDADFDASSFSDGTLRFIALATLLLQPMRFRPTVIVLDEPELGLHPYAIAMLASTLKSVCHESQIILATQSPIMLDHFEPEDVLVANRVNGQTQINRMESGLLQAWLERYSLGQLWEKNELGGRPVAENANSG